MSNSPPGTALQQYNLFAVLIVKNPKNKMPHPKSAAKITVPLAHDASKQLLKPLLAPYCQVTSGQ